MANQKPVPGTNGDHYIPYAERTGKNPSFTSRGICLRKACAVFSAAWAAA